jgi:hypothetical protein
MRRIQALLPTPSLLCWVQITSLLRQLVSGVWQDALLDVLLITVALLLREIVPTSICTK